ncbi:multiple sugar transport system substrate-binding protein [Streptosporangium album]|uniref:Multiple sugar transport system substrate-binding protein n=1 Tax=Streptosporangium album TaxID=47479 RepID=A0A7W7S2K8_9ACTN|nr:ABC transporter substrate-binding protein [Streptosporangium album]MBB4941816.1 multiple sugar transport system substrate-binding protein [Streptosporangium album]
MKGKKLALGLALSVALGGMAACGSGTGTGTAGTAAPSASGGGRGPLTFASGKFEAEATQKIVDAWNAKHPDEKVTSTVLPESADEQRRKLIQNAQTKSDALDVILIDAVWTSEFAANRWADELPADTFDASGFLPPAIDTGKYRDKLYAMPLFTGTGLLYYRKDLVEKPPTTWAEMTAACDRVLPKQKGMSCYGGQFDKYEGLTVNFSEAINSAGGEFVDASGRPALTSEGAKAGAAFLADGFKSGMIPKEAITYKEEEGRNAFQEGKLLFYRNWAYMYESSNKTDGSSKVAGKFDVAPLPGRSGIGAGTLGGNNLAVSSFSKHKETARDFIAFVTSAEQEKAFALINSTPLARASLYDDPELVKKYPYLPALKEGILAAKPRPKAVKYGDVTAAIQESAYAVVSGAKPADQALTELQAALTPLLQ